MNITKKVAFTLVELFESPDDSLKGVAGGTPLLIVGSCCCCSCDTVEEEVGVGVE